VTPQFFPSFSLFRRAFTLLFIAICLQSNIKIRPSWFTLFSSQDLLDIALLEEQVVERVFLTLVLFPYGPVSLLCHFAGLGTISSPLNASRED